MASFGDCLLIAAMVYVFLKVGKVLDDWEEHRLDGVVEQYEREHR